MKKIIALLAALLLAFSFVCPALAFADTGLELSLGEKSKLSPYITLSPEYLHEDGIYTADDSDMWTVFDDQGINRLGQRFTELIPLEGGVFQVRGNTGTPNCYRLVKSDGNILVYDWFCSLRSLGNRYLELVFVTGLVTNAQDAYVFVSENGNAYLTGDAKTDKMYAGFSRVYDLEKKNYVGGIVNRTRNTAFTQVGDSLLMEAPDGSQQIYGSDGVLLHTDKRLRAIGDYFVVERGAESGGSYVLLDSELKEISSLTFLPGSILTEELFVRFDIDANGDGQYLVVDREGERIIEQSFREYPKCAGNYLYGTTSEGEIQVYDLAGNMYARGNERLKTVKEAGYGYLTLTNEKEEEWLLCPDGSFVTLTAPIENMVSICEEGETGHILVLEQNEYSLEYAGKAEVLADFLVTVENGNGKALYSTVDGTLLLSGYEDYGYSLGKLYARGEEGWLSMPVELTQSEVTPLPPPEPTPEQSPEPEAEEEPAAEEAQLTVAEQEEEQGDTDSEEEAVLKPWMLIAAAGTAMMALALVCWMIARKRKKPPRPDVSETDPDGESYGGSETESLGAGTEVLPQQGTLRVMSGSMLNASIQLASRESIRIGTDGRYCHLVLDKADYPVVDRLHCTILFDGLTQSYTIRDDSACGSFVDNVRLPRGQAVTVGRGVTLTLGDNSCQLDLL